MVSSQSPPHEPCLTRSTWSTAVLEGPRSRGKKQQCNCPSPTSALGAFPPGPKARWQVLQMGAVGGAEWRRGGGQVELGEGVWRWYLFALSSLSQGCHGAPCNLTLILTSFGASFFTSLSNRSPKPVNTRLAEPRVHI